MVSLSFFPSPSYGFPLFSPHTPLITPFLNLSFLFFYFFPSIPLSAPTAPIAHAPARDAHTCVRDALMRTHWRACTTRLRVRLALFNFSIIY